MILISKYHKPISIRTCFFLKISSSLFQYQHHCLIDTTSRNSFHTFTTIQHRRLEHTTSRTSSHSSKTRRADPVSLIQDLTSRHPLTLSRPDDPILVSIFQNSTIPTSTFFKTRKNLHGQFRFTPN